MPFYELDPIDVWAGWVSAEEYIARAAEDSDGFAKEWATSVIKKRTEEARKMAKSAGWEGDFSVGPLYSGIPASGGNSHCEVIVGWKQYNNGTTFIYSPYRLPWLERG